MSAITDAGVVESKLFCSVYNFFVSDGVQDVAVYNARTGALLKLHGGDGLRLAENICGGSSQLDVDLFPLPLLEQLMSGGFLVVDKASEHAEIRAVYWRAREQTPMVLTITTTMDCNLGCYYCYESRTKEAIAFTDLSKIIDSTKKNLLDSGASSLHVDWYGGEPLLNIEMLEAASLALQKLCVELGVVYRSSVISNGTHWPEDVAGFVATHKIRQVQISFDGMEDNHNKRRRYRKGYSEATAQSSFAAAVEVVGKLVNCVRVDVRFNLDSKNAKDLLPFIRFSSGLGWYSGPVPAVFQPARISAYSEKSNFLKASQLTLEEFDSHRKQARNALNGIAKIEESEVPDGYPFPKTSVCAALAKKSQVIGADGLIYRCGLQVGEKKRAVGVVFGESSNLIQPVFKDASWWEDFDPTVQPTCSKCSFLPICGGGCPKKHLEQDVEALREQGKYWRTNLPRLIARKANIEIPNGFCFTDKDQFRS